MVYRIEVYDRNGDIWLWDTFVAKDIDDASIKALYTLVENDFSDEDKWHCSFWEESPKYVWSSKQHCFFPERQQ